MYYKDWEPIYKEILDDFNFSIKDDEKSADFLNNKLKKK